jgi:hypothetical protein
MELKRLWIGVAPVIGYFCLAWAQLILAPPVKFHRDPKNHSLVGLVIAPCCSAIYDLSNGLRIPASAPASPEGPAAAAVGQVALDFAPCCRKPRARVQVNDPGQVLGRFGIRSVGQPAIGKGLGFLSSHNARGSPIKCPASSFPNSCLGTLVCETLFRVRAGTRNRVSSTAFPNGVWERERIRVDPAEQTLALSVSSLVLESSGHGCLPTAFIRRA